MSAVAMLANQRLRRLLCGGLASEQPIAVAGKRLVPHVFGITARHNSAPPCVRHFMDHCSKRTTVIGRERIRLQRTREGAKCFHNFIMGVWISPEALLEPSKTLL